MLLKIILQLFNSVKEQTSIGYSCKPFFIFVMFFCNHITKVIYIIC